MSLKITFLGGAGTVTGSSYLLEADDHKYLVDCGLFQGSRKLKELNWSNFSFSPTEIDAVFLTHAHVDHVGLLPRMVQQGFGGPIYATEATCALLNLILPDSAHLQEQDAVFTNKKDYSRHKPALPLYTLTDAEDALQLLCPIPFHRPTSSSPVQAIWRPAGHILGSAILEILAGEGNRKTKLVFSGDLGRYDSEVMKPPFAIPQADVLLVESTYGDRLHGDGSIETKLAEELDYTLQGNGVLLIPAFAVGRTQQVLYYLRKLEDQNRIPRLPIYIDSPMAVDASHIYCKYGDDHNLDVNLLMDENACPLRCRQTNFVRDVEASKILTTTPGPAIIISASGMCNGGRILHHLKRRLPRKENSVLFIGFQAEGTRGRQLLEGTEHIRIHGDDVRVRARIAQAHALSGHADQSELLRWLSGFTAPPGISFIVHGEPKGSRGLQDQIAHRMGWKTTIPARGDTCEL